MWQNCWKIYIDISMTSISEVLKVMRRKKEQGINLSYKGTWCLMCDHQNCHNNRRYFLKAVLEMFSISTNASFAHTSTQTEKLFSSSRTGVYRWWKKNMNNDTIFFFYFQDVNEWQTHGTLIRHITNLIVYIRLCMMLHFGGYISSMLIVT